MYEKDQLKEFLNQSYAGFEPDLPENDWAEFQVKFQRKKKLLHIKWNTILLSAIALLFMFGIGGHRYIYHRKQIITKSFSSHNSPGKVIQRIKPKNSPTQNLTALPFDKKAIPEKAGHLSDKSLVQPVYSVTKEITGSSTLPVKNQSAIKTENKNQEKIFIAQNTVSGKIALNKFHFRQQFLNENKSKSPATGNKLAGNLLRPKISRPFIFIRLVASPSVTFPSYHLNNSRQSEVHENYKAVRDKSEKASLSFSGGINLDFKPAGNFSVTSGVIYRSYKSSSDYKFINNRIPVVDSATRNIVGYISIHDTIEKNFHTESQSDYIEVPLIINYKIFRLNNLSFGLKTGGSFAYHLKSAGNMLDPTFLNQKVLNNSQFNKTNWGVLFGFNCIWDAGEFISVGLEPVLSRFGNSAYKKTEIVGSKPWSLSMNCNLIFKL